MNENTIDSNEPIKTQIISKETTENLKLDKKKKKAQNDLAQKVKDIIYAILIFLSRFL